MTADTSRAIELYCPIEPRINPLATDMDTQIAAWVSSVGLYEHQQQCRRYEASRFGTLAARVCPDADRDALRLFAKWLAFGFFYDDEFFDEGGGRDVLGGAADAVVAFASVFAPDGLLPTLARWEDVGRRHRLDVAKDLLAQTRRAARPEQFSRFCAQMTLWSYSYLYEPVMRSVGRTSTLPGYAANRLYNIAAAPYVTLAEIVTNCPATAEDLSAPEVRRLDGLAAYQMAWCNDVYSAAREAEVDARVENLLSVLPSTDVTGKDQVTRHAVRIHDETMHSYLRLEAKLRDGARPALRAHIHVLRTWMRGYYDWCRETARYGALTDAVRPSELGSV